MPRLCNKVKLYKFDYKVTVAKVKLTIITIPLLHDYKALAWLTRIVIFIPGEVFIPVLLLNIPF